MNTIPERQALNHERRASGFGIERDRRSSLVERRGLAVPEASRRPSSPGQPDRLATVSVRRYINAALLAVLVLAVLHYCNIAGDEAREEAEANTSVRRLRAVAKDRSDSLDRQFVGHLRYQDGHGAVHAGSGADSSRNSVGTGQAADSQYSTAIVIGRRDNETERVQWVYDELVGIDRYALYVVDNPAAEGPHLVVNHGREAAVYMSYILENYDNLTDITFFWHNDKVVWHNSLLMQWNSVEALNRMDRDHIMREGYVPSRCDHWPGCPDWIRFNPSTAEHRLDPHKLEEMYNPTLFRRLFPDVKEFPPFFSGTCCSQFAVSRDTIRRHPKSFYQGLFDWIQEYEADFRSGMVFEFTWPFIFLGKGSHCPSMTECYCKTYNFCLEDKADIEELEGWNSLRTRREEVKWQVNFLMDARDERYSKLAASHAAPEALMAVNASFAPEVDRLTADLERLTDNTWNAREQIIRHWRLPPPPTGW